MTTEAWEQVIRDTACLGARRVCFIGGEPTRHPDLPHLIDVARTCGLQAEVYSNLVSIGPSLWQVLTRTGVSLATSWYTADRDQHRAITGRDTWRQTLHNIARAVELGIPLRAGIITGLLPDQMADEAELILRDTGVTVISRDEVRGFARGTLPDPSQACGHCGHGVAAILPDGSVTPCPMTRWLQAGNVTKTPLASLTGERMAELTQAIPPGRGPCDPTCMPDSDCPPLCTPGACKPWVR